MARINLGRRKIAMKKISSRKDLQVTFSKRRCGLFKKASELCILTGAEVSFIVFSPGGKPCSFGHPSVGAIVSRFFSGRQLLDSDDLGPSGDAISPLYQQHNELRNRLEAEKKRGEELMSNLLNFREKIAKELLLRKAFNSTPSAKSNELIDLNVCLKSTELIDLNVANPAEMEDSVYP